MADNRNSSEVEIFVYYKMRNHQPNEKYFNHAI